MTATEHITPCAFGIELSLAQRQQRLLAQQATENGPEQAGYYQAAYALEKVRRKHVLACSQCVASAEASEAAA